MNTTNNTNNENIMNNLKTPSIFYVFMGLIVFLVIMMYMILYDVNFSLNPNEPTKSQEQLIGNIFVILFFSLLVLGICIMFLPNLKDLKILFEQIGNVTYVILYTIFVILFYTMMSVQTLQTYYYIINPIVFLLGIFAFYKGYGENYVEKFNMQYERIKTLILLFCFLTIIITFYNIQPGKQSEKYFGYSFFITIILSVFAFLYLMIVMTLSNEEGATSGTNLLTHFSFFGKYGSILFSLFLIITFTVLSYKKDFFTNKAKFSSVVILLFIISILWSVLLCSNLFSNNAASIGDINKLKLFKYSLSLLFGIIVTGLFIFWITYNISNATSKTGIIQFILNIVILILVASFIYKTIYVKLPVGNTKKNSFFMLLLNILIYIPCLVSGIFDWFGKNIAGNANSETAGSFMILFVTILLCIAYLKMPSVWNIINLQGGTQLVNKPVYTDTLYSLGSYQELNGSETFDYQYAISCWVFIDAVGPNMNANSNHFTSLLNFGNKPNILYNAKDNTLMITMEQKDLKNITKNKLMDFDKEGNRIIYTNSEFLLQKWNNIIINYNGGTLDVFLNGELVKSSIEVVPYYTFDNLTIGENDGVKGGICNIVYFRKPLHSQNIYLLYHTMKNKDPPTLNESNETIMKKI
jgi:hypothetical protein